MFICQLLATLTPPKPATLFSLQYLITIKTFREIQSIESGSACTQATEFLRAAVRELAANTGGERGREARAKLAALLDAVRELQPQKAPMKDKTEKV